MWPPIDSVIDSVIDPDIDFLNTVNMFTLSFSGSMQLFSSGYPCQKDTPLPIA